MAYFMGLTPHGTPEMTSGHKIMMGRIIFLANLQSIFQGSQKMLVRVPISQKANVV